MPRTGKKQAFLRCRNEPPVPASAPARRPPPKRLQKAQLIPRAAGSIRPHMESRAEFPPLSRREGKDPSVHLSLYYMKADRRGAGGRARRRSRRTAGGGSPVLPFRASAHTGVGIPHQALRASFPRGKPGKKPFPCPVYRSCVSRLSSPPCGLPSLGGRRTQSFE